MTVLEAPPPRWHISVNALILIGACVALGWTLTIPTDLIGFLTFAFVAATWILSVGVHEFGHAFAAYKAGDHTVVEKGYLTLDPVKYSDLVTTIVFPLIALALGGIGFPGGAVYLREDLMRSAGWRSLASLAGPLGTLVVLLVLSLILPLTASQPALHAALALLALLQGSALILNLLPIPGLDGYGVIRPFLPEGVRQALAKVERVGFLILLALVFWVPGVSGFIIGGAVLICDLLGVPRQAIGAGWDAFHFWK